MAFWDWLAKKRPVGEDTTPPPNEPGAGIGAMRNGKKHGRWKERDEKPYTEWDSKKLKSVPVDYGWTELDYVDGVKQGPFVKWWGNGKREEECAYLDGELHGARRRYSREGVLTLEGVYEKGEATGRWRCNNTSLDIEYEGEYLNGKRHGPWRYRSVGTEERGSYVDGKREGEFVIEKRTGGSERGQYRLDLREGAWTVSDAGGATIEEGSYKTNVRIGTWTFRRADGSVRARGEYVDGKPAGEWSFMSTDGTERGRAAVSDDAAIAKWEDFYTAVDLLARYEWSKEWVELVRAAFTELSAAWQVSEKTDKHGQRWLSAPIGAHWQMRLALGDSIVTICRDECWSKITSMLEELPAEHVKAPAELVVARCGRYPSKVGRDWLTRILDDEHDDPRNNVVSRFEPGRELSRAQLARFAERVPHLQEITLRECTFPDGIAPLFARGFPELERLIVVRNNAGRGAYSELVDVLAKARWAGKLIQLAIVDCYDEITDVQLAALLANPALSSLKHLTLERMTFGDATAAVLANVQSLVSLDLRDSRIDAPALAALLRLPALQELTCRRCTLPVLTTRQAQALGPSKLKKLVLRETFELDRYSSDPKAWTPYALARRLAVMPALDSVEELDLSHNDLDDLAARVLARSPHLGKLRVLHWNGNRGETDPLREAFPSATIQTAAPRGNVVILG